MAPNKPFYDTVTLWPRYGKNLPVITKVFDNEALYSQFVEDHWHDKDYMVEYNGNRHLPCFISLKKHKNK
jgi:hypothetical protein